MSDSAAPSPGAPQALHPPAISLREELPWVVFGLSLLLLIYFVCIDEGAAALVPGSSLHEWVHDGRHLLGFPCH